MNKVVFSRNLNYEFRRFKDHLFFHRWYYIVLILISITAILTGIITVSKVSSDVSSSTITDIALVELISGDRSVISLILNRFLVYSLSIAVVFISSINVYMFGIEIFALISKGYFIGVNTTCLIIVYGISGTFNVVFIILPCAIISLLFQISLSSILMKRCVVERKFGKAASKQYTIKESWIILLLLFLLLGLVICLLEGLLLSIFVKRFILIL